MTPTILTAVTLGAVILLAVWRLATAEDFGEFGEND